MTNAARILLAIALTVGILGWIPQEKGKRKLRMAVAEPATATLVA